MFSGGWVTKVEKIQEQIKKYVARKQKQIYNLQSKCKHKKVDVTYSYDGKTVLCKQCGLFIDGWFMEPSNKIKLILAKVEILKLKANDYDWQCYVPDPIKQQLEQALADIDKMLEESK